MTRYAKLTIAAIATTLVATLGVVGTTSATAAPDKDKTSILLRERNWCC